MNTFHPLERVKDDGAEKAAKPNVPNQSKTPLAFCIIVWVLLAALTIHLLYILLVHPLDKLKMQILLTQSYEINVYGSTTQPPEIIIKVDGNLISVTESGIPDTKYYEIEGKKIYTYSLQSNGEWKKEATDITSIPLVGSGNDEDVSLDTLLNKRNYKRLPGILRSYATKDDVDIGDFKSIEFQRASGEYAFRFMLHPPESTSPTVLYRSFFTIVIEDFGKTQITPPWKES